jgi:transcription termination factor Rho
MFEISQLKEKKLTELQEIAKELNVPKFSSLKKIDLVYQILDLQAANPKIVATNQATETKTTTKSQKRAYYQN